MGEKIVENYENLSDEAIVSLVLSGDFEAVGVIIQRFYPTILYYINNLCPPEFKEDAIQEATFALYNAIKDFDPHKSNFSTFAGVCIKRSVLSFLKFQNRKKNIPSELLTPLEEIDIAVGNSPEKIFFDKNDYKLLTDNIKLELSPLEFKVLQLYISGYRYSVIADKLSISEKSVNNAMTRIRKKLKQE